MPAWICVTCGNQQASSVTPPPVCAICVDQRQYVGWGGQEWTTLEELAVDRRCVVSELEPGLWEITVDPPFAIGQRGLVVATAFGTVLWDVPGFVDEPAIVAVRQLGELRAITASHPHFYGVAVEWAHACDAPILLPAADRDWVLRPDSAHVFYEDEVEVVPGVRLVQCGGHFPGSAVLHWAAGAGGAGALFVGDTLTVVADRDWISIMWSYPNLIPLDRGTVRSVAARLDPVPFDRIYGGWTGRDVASGAKAKLKASIERYVAMIDGAGG